MLSGARCPGSPHATMHAATPAATTPQAQEGCLIANGFVRKARAAAARASRTGKFHERCARMAVGRKKEATACERCRDAARVARPLAAGRDDADAGVPVRISRAPY